MQQIEKYTWSKRGQPSTHRKNCKTCIKPLLNRYRHPKVVEGNRDVLGQLQFTERDP